MADAPRKSGGDVIEAEAIPMPSATGGTGPGGKGFGRVRPADNPASPPKQGRRRTAADALWAVPVLLVLLLGVKLVAFAAVAVVFCLRNPRLMTGLLGGLVALAAGKAARGARPVRRGGDSTR